MPPPTRKRLDPHVFDLPVEKMRAGWYTDAYFNHARAALLEDGRRPRVVMQVFQKQDSYLGGIDEAIAILKLCADDWDGLVVRALYDGDRTEPYETVLKNSLRRLCRRWKLQYLDVEAQKYYDGVPTWGPYEDVPAGLAKVAKEIPLVILERVSS